MPKRTIYTKITPLAPQVTRDIVVDMLHDHDLMIELNPLVIEHHPCTPPAHAEAEEFAKCKWQLLTDRVSYMPGGMVTGKVSYHASFYDLPYGLQTHIYAPLGLDIRGKWTVGGNAPGEPRVAEELGLNVPREGLYLREDVDMKCNMLMTGFVKKNLEKAHSVLVSRLLAKSEFVENVIYSQSRSGVTSPNPGPRTFSSSGSYTGSSPSAEQTEWRKASGLSLQAPRGSNNEIHELAPPTPAGPVELHSEPVVTITRSNTESTVGYNNADFYNTGFSNPSSARSQGFSDAGSGAVGMVSPRSVNTQGSNQAEYGDLRFTNVDSGDSQRYNHSGHGNLAIVSPASTGSHRSSHPHHDGPQVSNSNPIDNRRLGNPTHRTSGSSNPGSIDDNKLSYAAENSLATSDSGYGNSHQTDAGNNGMTLENPEFIKYASQRQANPFVRKG